MLHEDVSTHIKPVPLLFSVSSSGSGLVDSRIYPNSHLQRGASNSDSDRKKPTELWNREEQEEHEILGHSGLPPAPA